MFFVIVRLIVIITIWEIAGAIIANRYGFWFLGFIICAIISLALIFAVCPSRPLVALPSAAQEWDRKKTFREYLLILIGILLAVIGYFS